MYIDVCMCICMSVCMYINFCKRNNAKTKLNKEHLK